MHDDNKQYLKVTFDAIKPNFTNILVLLKENLNALETDPVIDWQLMPIFLSQINLVISKENDSQKLIHFINHLIDFSEETEHLEKFIQRKAESFFSTFSGIPDEVVLKSFSIFINCYIKTLMYCFEDQWTNSATLAWKELFQLIEAQYKKNNLKKNLSVDNTSSPTSKEMEASDIQPDNQEVNQEDNLDQLFKQHIEGTYSGQERSQSQVAHIEDAALDRKIKKMFEHYLQNEGVEVIENIIKKVISA